MGSHTREGVIEDIAFLTRSEHRVTALVALAEGPLTRDDLRDATGVSSSTISRTLRDFEKRHWVRRDGHRYDATKLGTFVAAKMDELIDHIETASKLRDVWQSLPMEVNDLHVEMVTDAVVTVAEATHPYRPVNRFVSLIQGTDKFRFVGFDLALFEPCHQEVFQHIIDGMETEVIDPPNVARYIRETYPERLSKALASGNLTVNVHDDLPDYGLCLFDDRVGICGHSPESGTVQVLIDTDAPDVREWAEETYETYRRDAQPLSSVAVL